ncbi:hypothetical protein Zm00014a_010975 [Zea mays]|jgi:hypothetical protein|uniref:Uncharacterized protein n=2 Tax=Zea mays TaxID=4577 RepID=A0A1D6ER47_MAIZE|nr:hypothetical protein ZEAMMB73_Zm00001d005830 [Zea mays]PWZ41893.1 hypothetical protein Zm00014a_010975 [Zea mays]|eukprot:XP_008670226.1 protein BIG GRAIN 1 [Zea mays]
MERRGNCHGGKHPPPRQARGPGERTRQPSSGGSFSASLLDAVYRSLDDGDGADVVVDAARGSGAEEKAAATAQFWWANKEAATARPRQSSSSADGDRRRRETGAARPRHSGYASSTTSSSDSSASYSSFSCSSASTTDTESTCRRHSPPPPRMSLSEESAATDAEEATATPPPPPKSKPKKKARPCFPVARIRPPKASVPSSSSSGAQPPSPATFACALKALFSSVRLQRKPKAPAATPPPKISQPQPQPQPPSMSATSTAKAADAPAEPSVQRTVRLRPEAEVSVVRRRVVEELVRSLEELEADEEGSDASSDLFELDSLRGAGADELPVYGTTSLVVANRAIAQGPAR